MKLDIKDHPSDSLISTFFTPYKSASEQISSVCHALIKTFSSSPPLFLPPLLHDQAIHKRNVETLCSNIYPSAFFPPFPLKHNTLLLSNQLAISLFDIFHRSKGKQIKAETDHTDKCSSIAELYGTKGHRRTLEFFFFLSQRSNKFRLTKTNISHSSI